MLDRFEPVIHQSYLVEHLRESVLRLLTQSLHRAFRLLLILPCFDLIHPLLHLGHLVNDFKYLLTLLLFLSPLLLHPYWLLSPLAEQLLECLCLSSNLLLQVLHHLNHFTHYHPGFVLLQGLLTMFLQLD